MATKWESAAVKAQLKTTTVRLGQLQRKMDSQGSITRKDITTLLQQGNVGLARVKAQNLIQEDVMGDLLEVLEMHVGLILEHFAEIDQNMSPSPVVAEAASSIIYAAPHTKSKDLHVVRNLLMQQLDEDFTRSAIVNHDNHVSSRVIQILSVPPPSATYLNSYLERMAQDYGVQWSPELRRQDILTPLSEILDPDSSPIVDLPLLRRLCSRGIPDEPGWLRPRIWKLFLGTLPVLKASWKSEIKKQRDSYYDLVNRLLAPFSDLPPPTTPLCALDSSLLTVFTHLSRVPVNLFNGLEASPELSTMGPLDTNAPSHIKLQCAGNLDIRLKILQGRDLQPSKTPEIRLQSDNDGALGSIYEQNTTVLPSTTYNDGNKNSSSLIRLLYLHATINPGNLSPHTPSLLIPLVSILKQEVEAEDLNHVEADAFWLLETLVGEFSEFDDDGGDIWIKKFSERLAWADIELSQNLYTRGLDPGLPHYSHRWLAPLLTHTLPLSSVLLIWDALFSRRMRERNINPKLDYLLDICTGMLICAKAPLFRLGKSIRGAAGLWKEESDVILPSLGAEPDDTFLEGLSLLQRYPMEAAGGIDMILQTAFDLARRRDEELDANKGDKPSLGTRLKVTMWRGFTNQMPSPEKSPIISEVPLNEDVGLSDDGNDTERPMDDVPSGLTSRLATTVWRGITNQTSMEAPPSTTSPSHSSNHPLPALETVDQGIRINGDTMDIPAPLNQVSSSIWGYAEKLKDSDAAAALAKVSTNWRAKALLGSWGVRESRTSGRPASEPPTPHRIVRSESVNVRVGEVIDATHERRGSLPDIEQSAAYSPPPRPAFFRPVRDSFIAIGRGAILSNPEPSQPTARPPTKSESQRMSKSGPRPLLLNSASLITTGQRERSTRSANTPTTGSPISEIGQWTEVMKLKGRSLDRMSPSSISSLSHSDAIGRPPKSHRSDWDSDTGGPSRLVPLNRKSISPMAPKFKSPNSRPTSEPSSATSSDQGFTRPTMPPSLMDAIARTSDRHEWNTYDISNSPASAPRNKSEATAIHHNDTVRVRESEQQRGSVVLRDTRNPMLEFPTEPRKVTPKKTTSGDTSDSSSVIPPRSPRVRAKRYPARPANIQTQDDNLRSRTAAENKSHNPNSLGVDWTSVDQDTSITPRASSFDAQELSSTSSILSKSPKRIRKVSTDGHERLRKISGEGHEVRVRKTSSDQRTRKVSADYKGAARKGRESAAEEGDDEGYDDLLSAYESEEGPVSLY